MILVSSSRGLKLGFPIASWFSPYSIICSVFSTGILCFSGSMIVVSWL